MAAKHVTFAGVTARREAFAGGPAGGVICHDLALVRPHQAPMGDTQSIRAEPNG